MLPQGIEIQAKNIDAAAEEILGVLEDRGKGNVMYFCGWNGLGTSAALKLVAQRLKSSTRLNKFDKVIHVDCSLWESRRALQKAIAEEIELPRSVMAIFDQRNEEDDFDGVDQGSRGEILQVKGEIFKNLAARRFVVVFHNGTDGYIDLDDFGIPAYAYLQNKVLWTEQGRFKPSEMFVPEEFAKFIGKSDAFLFADADADADGRTLWDLVHEEAKEVAEYTGMPECIDHRIVEECILYMWPLRVMKGIDWETHASNYWVCDGIIQTTTDRSAWEIGHALQSHICLDWSWRHMGRAVAFSTTHLQRDMPRQPPICCSSYPSSSKITSVVTSFFFLAEASQVDTILPTAMFQHSDSSRLRVLHLSFCTFSFASPPFRCCSQLRFLLLDHCTNTTDTEYQSHNENRSCFQKLLVLDLRYTEWYWLLSEKMMSLMADLRDLNVEGLKHWSITDFCGAGSSLVKLRVTADPVPADDDKKNNQAPFPNLSSANNLKTVNLDGCVGLEQVSPDVLPPSLESFSFLNNAAAAAKISSISFRGCSQLKSILLRGCLGSLEELDLSGTAVKTLDLREVEAPNLKRLILLGCEKLCAILWPPKHKRTKILEVLRIDTTRSASSDRANWEEKTKEACAATGSSAILVAAATKRGISRAASFDFKWSISVRDARLLRSLVAVKKYIRANSGHMEIDSSPSISSVALGGREVAQAIRSLQQPDQYLYARDAAFQGYLQAVAANKGAISWMWDCPPSPTLSPQTLYVHIQDEHEMKSRLLQQQQTSIEGTSTSAALPPYLICDNAELLHVHDSLSITSIPFPPGSVWNNLQWCRVERCPKLRSGFAIPTESSAYYIFGLLRTFWASQLPMLRYIWNWSAISQPYEDSFQALVFLHLDYCPRLIHVLPLSEDMYTFRCLETLEIVCCGDLREVFPLDPKRQEQQITIIFPKLRCIHLHELPALQRICGFRMSAPTLETVKIRGCWSLKRLPAIPGNTKRLKVDCEKEWWDSLKWDGTEVNHDPSLYEPSHSMYYKKAQLPRGTVLR